MAIAAVLDQVGVVLLRVIPAPPAAESATPVGLDLEWEDDPDASSCIVTGEVLVGDAAISVDGRGSRS